MKSPKFPEDFRVLYTEGASYWWWSPFTDESYDGSVLAGEPWPEGLMVGDGEQSHELTEGAAAYVTWVDSQLDHVETQFSSTGNYVQLAIDLTLNNLAEDGYLVEEDGKYRLRDSVPS